MTDWKAIKTDFVVNNTSQRDLAKKYGVSLSAISSRCKKENWVIEREQNQSKTSAKMIAKAAEYQVDRYARLIQVSDKVLEGIFKQLEDNGVPTDSKQLKAITGALKDLKEIQDCKGSLDMEEQKARIERLRAEVNNSVVDKDVKVIMDDSLEEYAR